MRKDDLRLARLVTSSGVLPSLTAGVPPIPPALTAQAAGVIYGQVARYGFNSFQMVQGGAQMASGDGTSVLTLLGTGWQFAEDLQRSAFQVALDKLGVALDEFVKWIPPGSRFMAHQIEVAGLWENLGGTADRYVASRFLKEQAAQLVQGFGDFEFRGGAIRLTLRRQSHDSFPEGIVFAEPPVDSIDVRVEPYFQDPSKLWLQINGLFPIPVSTVSTVTSRVEMVKNMLWNDLADRLALAD